MYIDIVRKNSEIERYEQMNENIKVYINKANKKYFVCAMFANNANVVCEICTSKKAAEKAADFYAKYYNCSII